MIQSDNAGSITVDYEEFCEFLGNYPRPFERDVCQIFEPALVTYNDFTLGDWPESIIAKHRIFDDVPYYTDIETNYRKVGNHLQNWWHITISGGEDE